MVALNYDEFRRRENYLERGGDLDSRRRIDVLGIESIPYNFRAGYNSHAEEQGKAYKVEKISRADYSTNTGGTANLSGSPSETAWA